MNGKMKTKYSKYNHQFIKLEKCLDAASGIANFVVKEQPVNNYYVMAINTS
jgi:hypothetical protein